MCREFEYLTTIQDLAVIAMKHGDLSPLVGALVSEECDRDIARHLVMLHHNMEPDCSLEETLIGRVFLSTLACKASLQ